MPGGRPSKLTADIIDKVKTFLPVCMYIETLADSLEIDRQTFYNWYHRGEAEARRLDQNGEETPPQREALYLEFYRAIKKGAADGEMAAAARIHAASHTTWQAAAWLLERRFPDKWGTRHRLEHTGKDGGPVKTEHKTTLTIEQASEIVRLAQQASEQERDSEKAPARLLPDIATPDSV
jgi:transposase